MAFPFILYFWLGGNPVLELSAERLYFEDLEIHFYKYEDDIFYVTGSVKTNRNFLEGVDVNSFELLTHQWAKDKTTVYFQHLSTPFDPKSFSILGCYFSDGQHVFYGANPADFILHPEKPMTEKLNVVSEDVDNFKIIQKDSPNNCVGVDSNHVYDSGQVIELADPRTFKMLTGSWAVDNRHVYVDISGFELIPDLSPVGLTPVAESDFVKNDTTVYAVSWTDPFYIDLEADPETFRSITINDGENWWHGEDKNFLYSKQGKKKAK